MGLDPTNPHVRIHKNSKTQQSAEILGGQQRCRNFGDDLRDIRTATMNQKPVGMTWTLGDVSKATFRDFRHPNSGTWAGDGRTLIHAKDHLTTMLFTLNPPSTRITLDTGSFTTQGPHCNTPLDFNHILYQTGTEPSCPVSKNNLVSSDELLCSLGFCSNTLKFFVLYLRFFRIFTQRYLFHMSSWKNAQIPFVLRHMHAHTCAHTHTLYLLLTPFQWQSGTWKIVSKCW